MAWECNVWILFIFCSIVRNDVLFGLCPWLMTQFLKLLEFPGRLCLLSFRRRPLLSTQSLCWWSDLEWRPLDSLKMGMVSRRPSEGENTHRVQGRGDGGQLGYRLSSVKTLEHQQKLISFQVREDIHPHARRVVHPVPPDHSGAGHTSASLRLAAHLYSFTISFKINW